MVEDGVFGGVFDIDGDGKLDPFEQTLEFMAISELLKEDDDLDYNDDLNSDDF